jgi:xanthine/CO dehydrogenase XdhC/CoxF family maturation factor
VPIGFQIAAETPEEIAISIASEIIMYRSLLEKRRKVMEENKMVDIYKSKLKQNGLA